MKYISENDVDTDVESVFLNACKFLVGIILVALIILSIFSPS